MKKVKIGISILLVALGAYIFADSWDLIPGPFTTKPPLAQPLPYPEVDELDVTEESAPDFATLPEIDSARLSTILDEMRTDVRMSGLPAVVVADPLKNETLVGINENQPIRPASTMKYLTAVSALSVLGPQTTFDTTVTIHNQDLYLLGGGDVGLASSSGNPQAVIGHAGITDLVDQVSENLAQKDSQFTLYVDSSRYSDEIFNPTVQREENTRYVMPIRPVAIDRGKQTTEKYAPFYSDPDILAAQECARQLQARGVDVVVAGRGVAPETATEIARVHSAPVRELVELMMSESDNTIAEILSHEVAVKTNLPPTFAGASKAVNAALTAQNFSTQGTIIDDSSGLSDLNRIPAQLLADILQRTWDCHGCTLSSLGASLPLASLDGTLHDRFVDSPARGAIRAKTGTLSTTTALAGYIQTKAGRPLIFVAIVSDHKENDILNIRAVIDDAVGKIVEEL
ncbi:D-alanyl-D-alanine carboxypeptidase/D-alanyl-D-alanine endopeptidase [Arcanobacterium pinnipediorum]|uniref:D-alanyl-D-alanine carboxypeptidase/D-alanyl-D-alanine-endopeptidase n=1 Tax=Arcanobacterium pinnipediorum TaxID=1503041 RepID=A0ABY5AHY1_9ACTO|nr:D-alanyl-D-alanine carboxypeptidase/D-alanyl-D-alanine-endopeptidase [Arcanobacterium pinnipediorum]USR79611.1 D-alanyl-D-alanine carboxypeptidase/D-alanyl-D-alanine-endopeptidase [Arcanobacterium pinnipediorum]